MSMNFYKISKYRVLHHCNCVRIIKIFLFSIIPIFISNHTEISKDKYFLNFWQKILKRFKILLRKCLLEQCRLKFFFFFCPLIFFMPERNLFYVTKLYLQNLPRNTDSEIKSSIEFVIEMSNWILPLTFEFFSCIVQNKLFSWKYLGGRNG